MPKAKTKAKAKLALSPKARAEVQEHIDLVVAAGFAGAARIALGHIEHGCYRVIPDFDELMKAKACLGGAMEIVEAAIDRAKERL